MRRKLVYIGAIAAVAFLFYQSFAPQEDLSEEIETTYRTLLKYRAALDNTEGAGTGFKEAEKELGKLEEGLLPGPSHARAVARLQTEVGDLAENAGLTITSVRPVNPVDRAPYQEITIQVNMNGTLIQLRDFLKALEEAKTILRIASLNVRVNNPRQPDTLRVKVAIAGMMKV